MNSASQHHDDTFSFQVLIAFFLMLGYLNLNLEYDEYVTVLSLLGCLTAGHLFSCLVVFQFRKNLLEEIAIERNGDAAGRGGGGNTELADPSAPDFDGKTPQTRC